MAALSIKKISAATSTFATFVFFVSLSWTAFFMLHTINDFDGRRNLRIKSYEPRQLSEVTTREIFLVGDSLMQTAESLFSISKRLQERLTHIYPTYRVKVKVFTENAYKMHNISMGLQEIFNLREEHRSPFPDMIFVWAYSDIYEEFHSDTPLSLVSAQVRYRKSLSHFLKFMNARHVHVGIIGPK